MREERPGGCASFAFANFANVLLLAQIVVLWLIYVWIHSTGRVDLLVCAAVALGPIGWWARFQRIEPALERAAERRFGPRPSAGWDAATGPRWVWNYFGRFPRGWRMVMWGFAVFAPVVQELVHAHP